MSLNRKLRMGMVGGGPGAFIGGVHRMAATLDGQIELVCGAFSSDPEKSKAAGQQLFLPENRSYPSFTAMIEAEKQLPEGERMDFISIVTPNHMHYAPAKAALQTGFAVVCDKPLAFTLEEAEELVQLVQETGIPFALTHNYTGYPMVRQARHLVESGVLGTIRKVVAEYPQGWLAAPAEQQGSKQADWRTDPARAGKSCCMGDIGTHAENLAEFITGLKITELSADLSTFVPGRLLDDDGSVLLHFEGGAKGILYASQISVGEENNLRIRVYGEKAGLEWFQAEPNTLLLKWNDKPMEVLRAGVNNAYLSPDAVAAARLPAGHPEGYLEAFANIYKEFALHLRAHLRSENKPNGVHYPTVQDGLRGMQFIETVVASASSTQRWTKFMD